jgi:hypothetical protein
MRAFATVSVEIVFPERQEAVPESTTLYACFHGSECNKNTKAWMYIYSVVSFRMLRTRVRAEAKVEHGFIWFLLHSIEGASMEVLVFTGSCQKIVAVRKVLILTWEFITAGFERCRHAMARSIQACTLWVGLHISPMIGKSPGCIFCAAGKARLCYQSLQELVLSNTREAHREKNAPRDFFFTVSLAGFFWHQLQGWAYFTYV